MGAFKPAEVISIEQVRFFVLAQRDHKWEGVAPGHPQQRTAARPGPNQ